MGRSQADVAATALVAVLACGAAASGAPPAAMIVLGIMLLAAPGYLLGQLLVGSRIAGLERVVVMTGLALAVPVLGGLLLYAARVPLHRPGWLGLPVRRMSSVRQRSRRSALSRVNCCQSSESA